MISLNELTRFDIRIYENMITINNIHSQYEGNEAANATLTELHKFKAWKKRKLKRFLGVRPSSCPKMHLS